MRLPVINTKQVPQLFCEKIRFVPLRTAPYREDIEALRLNSVLPFNQTPDDKIVIVAEDKNYAKIIEDYYEKNTNLLPVLIEATMAPSVLAKQFNTCRGVVLYNSQSPHLWMCQPGTTVIEFQEEIKPSLDSACLSHISGLKHYIVPVTKSIATKKQQDILQALKAIPFECSKVEEVQTASVQAPPTALKFETLFSLAAAQQQSQDVH